jgi:hypothetical protein
VEEAEKIDILAAEGDGDYTLCHLLLDAGAR